MTIVILSRSLHLHNVDKKNNLKLPYLPEVNPMRRRDFLTTICITLANLLYPTFGRANTVVRAAVVIGINKTGSLPVLRAAASGATVVGDWLEQEGFHVHRFIDDQGPVRHWQIFDAVNGIVKKGMG